MTIAGIAILGTMSMILVVQSVGQGKSSSHEPPMSRSVGVMQGSTNGGDTTAIVATPATETSESVIRALEYVTDRDMVRSGTPTVRLSLPVVPPVLNTLGFGSWPYEDGCDISLEVVILEGDFNTRNGMPAASPSDMEFPVRFVVFVFDTRIGDFMAMIGDPNGAVVKHALGDDTLPDPVEGEEFNPTRGLPIPCDPTAVELPGATEQDVEAYETQEASDASWETLEGTPGMTEP